MHIKDFERAKKIQNWLKDIRMNIQHLENEVNTTGLSEDLFQRQKQEKRADLEQRIHELESEFAAL